jgi:hypothetical protein
VKTGLFVQLHNWDTESQRSAGVNLSDLEVNEALDRLEHHLLRAMKQNDSRGMDLDDSILEKHVNQCFIVLNVINQKRFSII